MTNEDFMETIANPRLDQCKEILVGKSVEYSRNNDKFHNFRETARLRDINVFEAWDGMMNKHLTSVLDLVKDAKNGETITYRVLEEKITDLINYLVIFEGLVKDTHR